MSEKLDGRSQEMLRAQLVRRATALLGPDGAPVEPGMIETALIGAAARMFEEVTRRLDKVPGKQADNFYAAMGIGRDPALPARVPVALKLTDTAPGGLVAPSRTRLTADTGATPTIFETESGIALVRGKVAALTAADLNEDAIYLAPSGVVTPVLPAPAAVTRNVRSPAGAGATMVQVDPVLGLVKGMTIRFTGEGTPEYDITEVKNDVVSFAPALIGTIAKGDPLFVVDRFVPFAGSRNRQSHALYLSHPTMLDVAGALTITVAGVEPGQEMVWEWFGAGADGAPGWQAFDARFDVDHWALVKQEGKPEKTIVDGRNALWIRGRLDGSSAGASLTTRITMAVSSGGLCDKDHDQRCVAMKGTELPAVEYDAVAVTTPVVPNKPYYPFGREPRLYDAFYVGCAEAFGKAGAEVSLCLSLGGASLRRIVAVAGRESSYLFGIGTDHQLYAARFGNGMPIFSVVPAPRDGDRPAELPDDPHLSARIDFELVRIAIGGIGAVYLAEFPVGTPLVEGAILWTKLAAAAEDAAVPVGAVVVAHFGEGSVHAMVGTRLQCWRSRAYLLQAPQDAYDLIPIQGRDAALLIVDEGGQWRVRIKYSGITDPLDYALLAPGDLPAAGRAASAPPGDNFDHYHIAGYDDAAPASGEAALQLVKLDPGGAGPIVEVGTCPPLPITLEPPIEGNGDGPPVLVIATATPTRFIRRDGEFEPTFGIEAIGDSANPVRQIVFAGDRAMTQHWDRGLLYRAAPNGRLMRPIAFAGVQRQVVDDRDVPAGALYFVDKDEANGGGYLIGNGGGDRLLLALTAAGTASDPRRSGTFFAQAGEAGKLSQDGSLITLTEQSGTTSTATHAVDLFLSIAGQPIGIWHLRYDSDEEGWKLPAGSPDLAAPPPGADIAYQLLDPASDADLQLQDYFQLDPPDAFELSRLLSMSALRSFYSDFAVTQLHHFGNFSAIRLDHALIDGQTAVLTELTGGWTTLGPSDPANPALSWEYWNGASWWALDTDAYDFSDRTANLQISQGIFFKAPANLAETEVGGRKNLWIRARLVGGDYGEAKVTVISEVKGAKTEQTVTRDLSAIRAPYVISLRINYCVVEPVKPAIVVTADNLGMIDQTNANDAGLPVTIFPTVAEALAPQAVAAPDSNAIPDCCREMPAGTDTAVPGPVPNSAASRAVLIGFDQPIDQSPLSLFIDAIASGGDWTVKAALFRAGRFEEARILHDHSSGLGESGVIAIEVDQPPDRAFLFGTSAHWLRLAPKGDAAVWSPRLRGVYLNGVVATSVETRAIETLGTSSGAPDQQFQLFATPIDPDSLALRVAEPIGEDEALALGAAADIAGMPGPWVAWTRVDEFPAEGGGAPARLFTIDAERGLVAFGNGRNALVPPMGSAVLALAYQRVTGAAANAVRAGDKLQPASPIAGIDRVTALDGAAGGADVEAPESARARAPVKLANGSRIVTLADVENHVLARDPTIAQARAENRQGGTRLIVVGAGTRLIPPPSARKAIVHALEGVASFGLLTRLTVVGPRLLPIAVTLRIEPDPGVDFVDLEQAATAAILALCDHQTGGFDGRGWPVGTLPSADDIAAALAPLADRAVISDVTIARSDPDQAMPDPFPGDVLIRLDRADIAVRDYREVMA